MGVSCSILSVCPIHGLDLDQRGYIVRLPGCWSLTARSWPEMAIPDCAQPEVYREARQFQRLAIDYSTSLSPTSRESCQTQLATSMAVRIADAAVIAGLLGILCLYPPYLLVLRTPSEEPPSLASSTTRNISCDSKHRYSTEILSLNPLMIYISNFVRQEELHYLLTLG